MQMKSPAVLHASAASHLAHVPYIIGHGEYNTDVYVYMYIDLHFYLSVLSNAHI